MKRILSLIDGFFFRKISASGFGLMRIAWAAVILVFMLGSASDVVRYWSGVGIIPTMYEHLVLRNAYRFSLLSFITDPIPVVLLWITMLWCVACSMLGIRTRLMTILSFVFLCSFQERNVYILSSGDSLLRLIGFILVIAPTIDAYSLDRLHRKNTAPATMSIWPYRLLLWQYIVIYLTSVSDKLKGELWKNGTSIAAVFHHTDFFRFPKIVADYLTPLSHTLTWSWIGYSVLWALLLIPKSTWNVFPKRLRQHSLKRFLILGGVFFHGGIFLTMDVGLFSFAMFTGYVGLLLDEDFEVIRKFFNAGRKEKIIVLYDGSCGLCTRSMTILMSLDCLRRLRLINFRDSALRKQYAPDITEKNLDRAMHIRLPNGKIFTGFDAFKMLAKHLPALWISIPFLSLPFIGTIGRRIYARIAKRRLRCTEGHCVHQ